MINITIGEPKKVSGKASAFISFPYDNELVSIIRESTNRFWHPEQKLWEIPATSLVGFVSRASKYEIRIEGMLEQQHRKVNIPKGFKFKTQPFQHQIDGFEYALTNDCFLLGDEQGLGKTKQVIDAAVAKKLEKGYKHCLIVCGVNGLKWNWQNEVATHSNESAFILGTRTNSKGKTKIGSNKDKLADLENLPDAYFLITNVETLRYAEQVKKGSKKVSVYPVLDKLVELTKSGVIGVVAIDEIHKCKSPTSQQGKAILKLEPKERIAMTGTPLMNQPLDLYIILKWLGYEKHSFYQFKNHYCVKGSFNEVVGYKNLHELRSSLNEVMLRRLKKEVLDLPEKVHTTEYVEMDAKQRKIYDEVKAEIKSNIDLIKVSNNPLAQLIRLRQATGYTGILSSSVKVSAKLDRMEELVEEYVQGGEKVIIFSNWTSVTDEAVSRLKQYNPAVITGETTDRPQQEAKFMKDKDCKVIVGTIGAMGTGLTLTAATEVIFLDEPWNKALKDQAEDRAHRIGTTGTVNIVTLITKDTIDERIFEIVEGKGAMSDMLIDGVGVPKNPQLIDFLLS